MRTKILSLLALMLFSVCALSQNTNHGTGAGNAGSLNTSIGYYAGDLVTGTSNVFVGNAAGKNTANGNLNVFVGNNAGYYNIAGGSNIAIGGTAGYSNTSGSRNVFIGLNSGYNNILGNNNSFYGHQSGYGTTGSSNTYLGSQSCMNCTTGSNNVVLGASAGLSGSTGFNNVYIGAASGRFGSGSNNVFIGNNSGYSETGSNKLYIENSDSALPLIYGDFATDKVGINSLPNTTHTLTVGGTIHSTGLYVNGVLVSGDLSLWSRTGTNVYTQSTTDNIGIGTTLASNPNSYKLAVNGKIGAKEVQIENTSLTWPDFVFKAGYTLRSLAEVEAFINVNGHLPEIPSEEQVKQEGIKVSELNAKLLQKIEELTLYVIELKKEVDALKAEKN